MIFIQQHLLCLGTKLHQDFIRKVYKGVPYNWLLSVQIDKYKTKFTTFWAILFTTITIYDDLGWVQNICTKRVENTNCWLTGKYDLSFLIVLKWFQLYVVSSLWLILSCKEGLHKADPCSFLCAHCLVLIPRNKQLLNGCWIIPPSNWRQICENCKRYIDRVRLNYQTLKTL